ncbi:MAG: RIP metalloprotease RseP [Pseudomonadota bacterium]|nr:RIP metalloprotease RseP [Pseudomonadota bacterium]
MQDLLFTAASFVVALAILITVHEFGHFWVARKLGVKVLRFSVGFGRPLLRWVSPRDGTEYVVATVPLGGYVKMLDEREETVAAQERHLAFNRQTLWKRFAIVAAGPLFNFLFAILAYWGILVAGDVGTRALVGEVAPDSIAAEAQFTSGDELLAVGDRPTPTWESAVFALMAEVLDGEDLPVRVREQRGREVVRLLDGDALAGLPDDPAILSNLGLSPARPALPPIIGELVPGEAAEEAGLRSGDRILTADDADVAGWKEWVEIVQRHPGETLRLEVERGADVVALDLTPRRIDGPEGDIGRIGAAAHIPEALFEDYKTEIRLGPLDAVGAAVEKTADMSLLMLRVIGRMLVGKASVKNLSGPISIAETAGKTASFGLEYFIKFLAVVSISLGVLNLLPIPILDGGHLLYFAIEAVKGSPLSEQAQLQGQRIGLALLAALMTLAFYVDITRLLGG